MVSHRDRAESNHTDRVERSEEAVDVEVTSPVRYAFFQPGTYEVLTRDVPRPDFPMVRANAPEPDECESE